MKVKALISFVSETVSPSEGEVIDVPEPQAAAWIKARLVEVVRAVPVETAVAPPAPERAVTRRSK
jgi:hypothetical protein